MKNKNALIVVVVVDLIVFAIIAAVVVMKARQPGQEPLSKAATKQTETPPAETKKKTRLYFYDSSMSRLVAQTLPPESGKITKEERVRLCAKKLLSGPSKRSSLVATFPEDVKVKEINVHGDTVTVDFNKNFLKPYGAIMEIGMVGSLVLSLTDIPGIKKVQILCEGEKVPYLPEGMEIGSTLTRDDFSDAGGNNSNK